MRRRWIGHSRRSPLDDGLRHFLETGDWREVKSLEHYAAAGQIMRGSLEPLRALWEMHGAEILNDWRGPGRPWALERLSG